MDNMEVLLNKLRENVELFNLLEKEDIIYILSKGIKVTLPENYCLMEEGELGSDFYIILKGELIAYKIKDNLDIQIINKLEPGNIVGELAAFFNAKRTAFVKCCKDTILLKYTGNIIEHIENENIHLALKLYKNLLRILGKKFVEQNNILLNNKLHL